MPVPTASRQAPWTGCRGSPGVLSWAPSPCRSGINRCEHIQPMVTKFERARVTAQEALQFHAQGKPGKFEITPTKPLVTQRDLSLAYSPGVAIPVQAIADDPAC